MSSNYSISSFFVIVALLCATASPLAHGFFFFNPITTLTVRGRVCCTNTGNCADGSIGIATAPATLNCPTGVVATTITDAAGNFFFDAVTIPQPASPSLCKVVFALPLTGTAATSCVLLSTPAAGSLVGPVVVTDNGIFTGGFFNFFGGVRNVFGNVLLFIRNPV